MSLERYRWCVAMSVNLCSACVSVPTHYYTLSPPGARPPVSAQEASIAIEVRTTAPTLLNRTNLMIRTGDTEVTLLENERWVSSVKDEISDAIRFQLQRRLGPQMESQAPRPLQGFSRMSVTVDIQRLESELGEYALLEASWSARLSKANNQPNDVVIGRCVFRVSETIRAGYAEMVEGYQREVKELANAIFDAVTSGGQGEEALAAHRVCLSHLAMGD